MKKPGTKKKIKSPKLRKASAKERVKVEVRVRKKKKIQRDLLLIVKQSS